jgi:ribonucleoside-diphosphate reductase alpha chain
LAAPEIEWSEISRHVWETKYRDAAVAETSLDATWRRVAAAAARVDGGPRPAEVETTFRDILTGFRFLPGGRILAGAGTTATRTLANCFVMGPIEDSVDGIFERLKESALTMQWGGGIGCDFSTLRPSGAAAMTSGSIASGPVSFMRIWDAMCGTLLSTGARRGAMMATLRCDHPDIETFVTVKRDAGQLRNFNLSVQVTDAFMQALAAGSDWPLSFPRERDEQGGETVELHWPGRDGPVPCRVWRRVPARELWREIVDSAYDSAEPGVLFVDRINRANNLYYCEHITCTNPCGEVPLPAHGACTLGSVNLTAFVHSPFGVRAEIDFAGLDRTVATAVRFLDDVVELSKYPLPQQRAQAQATRRIGLGVTGLADALCMLGLDYDSDAGRATAARVLERIRDAAYRASAALAAEKGAFPAFERDAYLAGEFVTRLPADIRDALARTGVRNSHLLAVAPTGTISLLANNVSSGVEPIFSVDSERKVLDETGERRTYRVEDYAAALWRREQRGPLPATFVTAAELSPDAHLAMLAGLQPFVDNAISKTINVAENLPREVVAQVFEKSYRLGLKGCTVFRPNPITGAVLTAAAPTSAVHCCTPDREAD